MAESSQNHGHHSRCITRDDSLNQSIETHLNGNARHMQMMIQTLLGGLTFNSNESVASFIFIFPVFICDAWYSSFLFLTLCSGVKQMPHIRIPMWLAAAGASELAPLTCVPPFRTWAPIFIFGGKFEQSGKYLITRTLRCDLDVSAVIFPCKSVDRNFVFFFKFKDFLLFVCSLTRNRRFRTWFFLFVRDQLSIHNEPGVK